MGWGGSTAGPGVPFRLLVTACPLRNVLFKTRLSSNAAYCNNKRTSSAVCEDAHAATPGDSGGSVWLTATGTETAAGRTP